MPKKVFVSGCFDLLHSGHVAFLEEAASYGDLYVGLAAQTKPYTILKRPRPCQQRRKRVYMIQSLSFVKQAFISSGSGMLDFFEELKEIKPDLLIVNEDGNISGQTQVMP